MASVDAAGGGDAARAHGKRRLASNSSDGSSGDDVCVTDDAHTARAGALVTEDEGGGPARASTPLPARVVDELDVECEQRNNYAGVKRIVRVTVRGWRDVADEELDVSPVRGGITNALLKVRRLERRAREDESEELPASETPVARTVVVRIFGKGTEQFITHRKVQGETTHVLNEHGFGAQVLGVFSNGLVEEFIEAESIAPEELASGGALLRRVATQMRRLHRDVQPDLEPRVGRGGGVQKAREHAIWDTLQLWFDLAYGVTKDPSMAKNDPAKRAALDALKIDEEARRLLFEVVRARCDKVNSQTVYCHNDIHAGNFLINRQTDDLTLIDYEYADYGPRAFDMANLFCEFAGFECNYDQYPTDALRREFYSAYLGVPLTSKELDSLENEIAAWTPVTHAFWSLWAVIQAKYSSIDFDFLGFAAMRMKVFHFSATDETRWIPTNSAIGRASVEKPQGWNATAEGEL